MANPATLHRFRIELSDIDRNRYESLDFRVAMHPSESTAYLLSRVLAYALNFESGLVFSAGLCTPDEPALQVPDSQGGIQLWIDIGNPSARRLHKASKAARVVKVYTYKDPENLKRETAGEPIHRAEEIEIHALDPVFLESLAGALRRDNAWTLTHHDGELVVTAGDGTFMGSVHRHRLPNR